MDKQHKDQIMEMFDIFNIKPFSDEYELNTEWVSFYFDIHVDINLISLMMTIDEVISKFPKTRYSLKIKQKSKKHPGSIRINKKGEKIMTLQQTKILSL